MARQFKAYTQSDDSLFTSKTGKGVPISHWRAHVVSDVVDALDLTEVYRKYGMGSGPKAYDPRMLLKVVMYAYAEGVHSYRGMENALSSGNRFEWLANNELVSYSTLCRFMRAIRGALSGLFTQVVKIIEGKGLVTLQEAYTDGTKIEARSNRNTFVWRKSVEKRRRKLLERLRGALGRVSKEDVGGLSDGEVIWRAEEAAGEIEEARGRREAEGRKPTAGEREADKAAREMAKGVERARAYGGQIGICGGRNSYSKTDHDATFMRPKDAPAGSNVTRPAYNVQITTENQVIVDYMVTQDRNDCNSLIPMLESFHGRYGHYPEAQSADSGYGSHLNYLFMNDKGVRPYVKYPRFDLEQGRMDGAAGRSGKLVKEDFRYDEATDTVSCPGGRALRKARTTVEAVGGVTGAVDHYESGDCEGCPLLARCHEEGRRRTVTRNASLERCKGVARAALTSDEGRRMMARRRVEVESVFGQIKGNMGFRRFNFFGLQGVSMEFGLMAMAHNIRKLASALARGAGKGSKGLERRVV